MEWKTFDSIEKQGSTLIFLLARQDSHLIISFICFQEDEDYIWASCTFRTFEEEEYESPESSDEEEE